MSRFEMEFPRNSSKDPNLITKYHVWEKGELYIEFYVPRDSLLFEVARAKGMLPDAFIRHVVREELSHWMDVSNDKEDHCAVVRQTVTQDKEGRGE